MRPFFEIPYYHRTLSPAWARELLRQSREIPGVPGLREVGVGGGLETPEALRFLAELYAETKDELRALLEQRMQDRKFIDERMRACHVFNSEMGRDWLDKDYLLPLGLQDARGRVVMGSLGDHALKPGGRPVAELPEHLRGVHVTLFGPPDSAKMAINAMNAYHRKLPGEPAIVEELLSAQKSSPYWGADDEDSKTPIRSDLVDAGVNLTACFDGTLEHREGTKHYALAKDNLALPIKRFPGLALPCTFLFQGENPIPLHLYDFALHLFRNHGNAKALTFYVPKLENEEEARYLHRMIARAEAKIQARHPEYKLGTTRLMIVLENPRAILRAHEIMDALHPYFAGASLGWHDYLASTARLFRNEPHYRIPVKADPDIVIKYIQASHRLLSDVVGSRGGIQVGGMYGILPIGTDPRSPSFQITLRGFIKDVVTQLKRKLTGFWVAHPDFVRLGLAFVEAWRRHEAGDSAALRALVSGLLEPALAAETQKFIDGPDIQGLDREDPHYVRALIVADIAQSDFIPNNDPEEIRYNVFQSLQYLADWLAGSGCVALPTVISGTPVRVMDDLATAERSRWEVWHELHHGRFALEDFVRIAHEEMNFIRRDRSDTKKIVQVKWDARTAKWYPIAFRLMLKLMTDREPAEFAPELLQPFTVESVRESADPWAQALKIDPAKFALEPKVARLDHYFEILGVNRFAREMAGLALEDPREAERIVLSLTREELLQGASFHGDIGQSRATLDARAAGEQAGVDPNAEKLLEELRACGAQYLEKHGFKFLISAQGRSGEEMLAQLRERLGNTTEQELVNARQALWQITQKRMGTAPRATDRLDELRKKHKVNAAQIAVSLAGHAQSLVFGEGVSASTPFQIASLSKMLASAFACEHFARAGLGLNSKVNALLEQAGSPYRIPQGEAVEIAHLLSHRALNLHYVNGAKRSQRLPRALELLSGHAALGYAPVALAHPAGTRFQYSGGGFLVLEHLLEARLGAPIHEAMRSFFEQLGHTEWGLDPAGPCAAGYRADGREVEGGALQFPLLAAGMLASARAVQSFMHALESAYHDLGGAGPIAHATAVRMLHGSDFGARVFMGCDMGLGVFVIEAGENRFALHQGANDGFRALSLHCFKGPDRGKGFTILCNADNNGVPFVAEAARLLLRELKVTGVDFERWSDARFDLTRIPEEQIVNRGYKELLLSAFQPDLPEEIVVRGPIHPWSAKNLVVGAEITRVTNQRFARAENLLSPHEPVFDPELFGRQGKIMDSWESARHNLAGVEELEFKLKRASSVRFISLSTKFHDGNQAESIELEGRIANGDWVPLLPRTSMLGHAHWEAELPSETPVFTHIRARMFPDGGFTRLGLYSEAPAKFPPLNLARCTRFLDAIPKSLKPLTIPYAPDATEIAANRKRARSPDAASLALGARVLRASNEHYGPAAQVISPFPPLHMFDGLESARSRNPGHYEEVDLALAWPARVQSVLLDFTFFVNNNPVEVSLFGRPSKGAEWTELLVRVPVKAFAGGALELELPLRPLCAELRVRTHPDGGINRIKVRAEAPLA